LSFGGGVAALLAQVGCELSPQPTIARNEDRVASSEPDEILFSYSLPQLARNNIMPIEALAA
jgi:hypothetical protein